MIPSEVYIGISGVGCEIGSFDLGHGVSLRTTYAHLMAPFMVAFARPERPGQHHPHLGQRRVVDTVLMLQLNCPFHPVRYPRCRTRAPQLRGGLWHF